MTYNPQRRTALTRAFTEIARRRPNGTGQLALRAGQQGNARRAPGGGPKCLAFGLSQALLQFFVDKVQQLFCRADSTMLMNHARGLRQQLLDGGMPEHKVPILTGNTGANWFARWRREYRIVTKVCALQMKVSWSKVKNRTRVLLLNIFRLRDLWRRVHPEKAMRFISFDEKPSWMNNAGLTGTFCQKGSDPNVREDFA